MAPKAKPLLPSITWLLAPLTGIVLLLSRLEEFAQNSMRFLAWPWQFDFTEGVDLDAVNLLAQGANIYRHNSADSFVSAPYTPIYFVVNAAITRITGPSFGPGRAISVGATVLIACLIVYVVWLVGRGNYKVRSTKYAAGAGDQATEVGWPGSERVLLLACGVFAGVLWLALSPVIVWAPLYTPSMLALAFGMMGIAWTLRFRRDRRVYWGIGFFLLAFYTKQSAVDAALAASVWLLFVRFRVGLRALRYGLGLVASLVLSFGLINFLLDGGLWEHTFANQLLPWGYNRFTESARKLIGEYWPLLVWNLAAFVIAPFALIVWRAKGRTVGVAFLDLFAIPLAFLTLYFVIAAVTTATRIGRIGTNYNHLLDLLLPACPFVGVTLFMVCRSFMKWKIGVDSLVRLILSCAGLLGMGALTAAQLQSFTPITNWYKGPWPAANFDVQMKQLSNLVSNTQGPIYSEDTWLLLSNGRQVVYDDPFMFVQLANTGKWDDRVLNKDLREHRFALMLLEPESGRFTPKGMQLFYDNYSLLYRDIRFSYAPNPGP